MDRRDIGSWLTTPGQIHETIGKPQDFRGANLGLPEYGRGSITPVWRRVVALCVDWITSLIIAGFIGPAIAWADRGLLTLTIFALQITAFQALAGSSFGQRMLGVAVIRIDGGRLGVLPLLARSALICLVVPPLIWDQDTRGLHDRAVRTVCVLR